MWGVLVCCPLHPVSLLFGPSLFFISVLLNLDSSPSSFFSMWGPCPRKEPWLVSWVYRVRLLQLLWDKAPSVSVAILRLARIAFHLVLGYLGVILFSGPTDALLFSSTDLCSCLSCGCWCFFLSCLYKGVYEGALSSGFVLNVIREFFSCYLVALSLCGDSEIPKAMLPLL